MAYCYYYHYYYKYATIIYHLLYTTHQLRGPCSCFSTPAGVSGYCFSVFQFFSFELQPVPQIPVFQFFSFSVFQFFSSELQPGPQIPVFQFFSFSALSSSRGLRFIFFSCSVLHAFKFETQNYEKGGSQGWCLPYIYI